MKNKVGIGYDVHKLKEGLPLFIGGIQIEHNKGAEGHSDSDVLIHAIIDALLGAASLRDIGFNYPDSDQKYKGIDSKILLKDTLNKIKEKGFCIENIDSIVVLQEPKIGIYIPKMQSTIANILNIDVDDVSIKATTTEHLGFVGQKEGVASYAICMLSKP
ncbi:MAG: 2-C-methyl-D-erythritol 2,4-cyclodiphosphate synthase [Bacteroidales bacterium]|jgi:2-C-methyl-D-erythritol 2,4-cyclodiphosphate synthase|nr:2-C-methyl-D-erythritol 2,4-cyclodiphosphate synthase [Bacteroidales bacterium]